MKGLLKLSRAIDAVNFRIGKVLSWLILIVVIISAVNATVRKVFDMSSNAWLELQWVLFGAIFLSVAGFSPGQRPWQSVAIGTIAVTFVLSARITVG